MLRSIGYDNIILELILTSTQWRELKRQCKFHADGAIALIPGKIFFEVKKTIGSYVIVLCNLNVPKLRFDNNIVLADHTDTIDAFEKAEKLLPISVSLSKAKVRSVHIAYTQDTPYSYDLWKGHFTSPKRGTWKVENQESGRYFNGKGLTLLVYSKDEQMRYKKLPIPKSISDRSDYDHLIRVEMRVSDAFIQKRMRPHSSLIGSNLCSTQGFHAFLRFFRQKVSEFILLSQQYIPSAIERVVLADPERSFKFFSKAAQISDKQIKEGYEQLFAIQASSRPRELLSGIEEECSRLYECSNTMKVIGYINTKEMEYAKSESIF